MSGHGIPSAPSPARRAVTSTLALALALLCISLPALGKDKRAPEPDITPSPITEAEVVRLDDGKRASAFGKLIRTSWKERCEPSETILGQRLKDGGSGWFVRCKGSTQQADYVVTIPVERDAGARVLKCFAKPNDAMSCNLTGKPD